MKFNPTFLIIARKAKVKYAFVSNTGDKLVASPCGVLESGLAYSLRLSLVTGSDDGKADSDGD